MGWGIGLLFLCLSILHVGEKIQRTLEIVNWPVVVIMVALVAAGTIIGGKRVKISTEEAPFKIDEENLRRWKGWVNTARIDSWIVMSLLTFITVFFTSTLAYGLLVPRGLAPMGFACAAVQAKVLSEVIGPAAWFLILFAGFLMLIGTQMGLMDSVARVITDNFWVASERARRWSREDPRRLYYTVLYVLFAVALILLIGMIGFKWASPFELTAIGSCLGLFALSIAFPLQIVVNYKFLPKQLRPSIATTIILVIGTIWNLFFLVGLAVQVLTGVRL